eukprot:CAMPEP_0172440398 /NCGR_PEP_ID=MMETSP1065-20121228/1019_1 /TAXON_ID=265537 /ORGANISM="Amphiprora paludosa, Strain CCMP125" /LENGTH=82 /DNA_ID=CAMNT_0013189191 /DNA_START=597 /DNA_END=845 /DNA_ORIENTATION=-
MSPANSRTVANCLRSRLKPKVSIALLLCKKELIDLAVSGDTVGSIRFPSASIRALDLAFRDDIPRPLHLSRQMTKFATPRAR